MGTLDQGAHLPDLTVPDIGAVTTWTDLTDVAEPLVSFRQVFRFERARSELVSDSTLRFRTADEITATLRTAGFDLRDLRDAPDRPGLELVAMAQRGIG